MTVFGGALTDGFFVICTKCGWHSMVEVSIKDEIGFKTVFFKCNHCGNEHDEA